MALKNQVIGFTILVVIFFLSSCQSHKNRLDVDVSHIDIGTIEIKRYEQKLFDIDPTNLVSELQDLQTDYHVFLNGDLSDSLNFLPLLNYINDTVLQNVNTDCQREYPDLDNFEAEFTDAFRHIKYYYPEFELPAIYTYISGFDYNNPSQLMGNNLLIALDMYLGKDYFRYKKLGLPAYMLNRFDRQYIVRDCMKELAKNEIDYKNIGSSLLDMMVNEGKIIYYTRAMAPTISDFTLMNFTPEQMEWAISSEGTVWAFLLENEMLYAKENQPIQKFIHESPFTSYFGAESPPRLGWFIGWKIVNDFMQNNPEVNLPKLMQEYDAQKILRLSGYKPGI